MTAAAQAAMLVEGLPQFVQPALQALEAGAGRPEVAISGH